MQDRVFCFFDTVAGYVPVCTSIKVQEWNGTKWHFYVLGNNRNRIRKSQTGYRKYSTKGDNGRPSIASVSRKWDVGIQLKNVLSHLPVKKLHQVSAALIKEIEERKE